MYRIVVTCTSGKHTCMSDTVWTVKAKSQRLVKTVLTFKTSGFIILLAACTLFTHAHTHTHTHTHN